MMSRVLGRAKHGRINVKRRSHGIIIASDAIVWLDLLMTLLITIRQVSPSGATLLPSA